ncbi:MAG: hypothetical protein ACRYFZ_10360 [Janthinobacterium lividum]
MPPSPPLTATAPPESYLDQMLAFITELGISVREAHFDEPSFLPGIFIENGGLVLDRTELLYPGDVLHEAGHLAVTPTAERLLVQANVTENNPAKEGEEMAVLLWTYAACQLLDIPEEVVFHPAGYKGQSDWLLDNFRSGHYIGLPLLVWMGLTTTEGFPQMTQWLRE